MAATTGTAVKATTPSVVPPASTADLHAGQRQRGRLPVPEAIEQQVGGDHDQVVHERCHRGRREAAAGLEERRRHQPGGVEQELHEEDGEEAGAELSLVGADGGIGLGRRQDAHGQRRDHQGEDHEDAERGQEPAQHGVGQAVAGPVALVRGHERGHQDGVERPGGEQLEQDVRHRVRRLVSCSRDRSCRAPQWPPAPGRSRGLARRRGQAGDAGRGPAERVVALRPPSPGSPWSPGSAGSPASSSSPRCSGRRRSGDVYETANLVPNILFELFAAGSVQAVMVPALVAADERDGSGNRLANAVLGWLLATLGVLMAFALVVAPLAMRVLTAAEPDAAVRADKRELGTRFLAIFLVQLLFYAAGLVATALLQARRRFAAPAVAPLVNNVVVIAAYLLFDRLRDGKPPSLSLSGVEVAVLAGGTTLGVVAFTAVPVVAAMRHGVRWRPRLTRDAAIVRLARQGAWAGAYLGLTQLLTLGVLVIGNGASGTVARFTFALAFFQAALRAHRRARGDGALPGHGQRRAGPRQRPAGPVGGRRGGDDRGRVHAGQRRPPGAGVAPGPADRVRARRRGRDRAAGPRCRRLRARARRRTASSSC